ncbi:AMP-dependent ligase [Nocardia nova SH22a]|uniref:AMP-dependent ligase n=1 Tax=Nocardia nova SH22a TaxID=1415166 RepID=W5TMX8_9NOCA|nr:AMP-binding protein [Nocardia nova]AHH18596.1 AMP-dependent ligase [Nocardia nova SH22a]
MRLHPFTGMTVWDLLVSRAAVRNDRPAMVWHPYQGVGATWSYSDLLRDAAAVAVGLRARGVRVGDRVIIHLENCPEFVISWLACAAIGAVAVTTNSRSAPDEIGYFAEHCGAVGAITQPRLAATLAAGAPGLGWIVSTGNDAGVPAGPGQRPDAASSFASLRGNPDDLEPVPLDSAQPMSVQYTSGTTSRPKGVLWTHANALWGARVNAVHEDLHPDDCHLVHMPLFHTNALAYSVLASLWVGARFVLVPKWSTSRFWDVSLRHGCTWLSLSPPAIATLAGGPPAGGSPYRMFGTGLCDMPHDKLYGIKTLGWWGMTETISHPIVGDPFTPNLPMSMGRPAPEYRVAVVRDDGVTPVEPEETGNLIVRGRRGLSLFQEYLDDPAATADSFDERGWFRTGDLVVPHADGHLSFVDRVKDMLRVGAENVAASEVERVVRLVPGVAEVAVVSRPDERLDEVPVAFVVASDPRPDLPDRVRARCAEMLADFKVPRAVYVVRELPRSTVRKVNKVELRRVAHEDADRDAAERRWLSETTLDPSGDAN